MSVATLFPLPVVPFTCSPRVLLNGLPGRKPAHEAVLNALIETATVMGGYESVATRKEIAARADLGETTTSQCLNDIRRHGVITWERDLFARSRRRYFFLWQRASADQAADDSAERASAQVPARSARSLPGAERAADCAHAFKSIKSPEETVPSPTPPLPIATPPEPAIPATDGTGRDDCASLPEEEGRGGEAEAPEAPSWDCPTPEMIAEARQRLQALIELSERGRPTPERRERLAGLRRLARFDAGDHSARLPDESPPRPSRPPAPPPPPPPRRARVAPDPALPLAPGLDRLVALGKPGLVFGEHDRVAEYFVRRWRDIVDGVPNPVTLKFFRRALRHLGPEWIRDLVIVAEDPTSDNPARVFVRETKPLVDRESRRRP